MAEKKNIKSISRAVGVLLAVTSTLVLAEIELNVSENDRGWVAARDMIELRIIETDPVSRAGEIRIFVGLEDITSLFVEPMPGRYRKPRGTLALPAGEQEITVYRVVTENQWQEIGRASLQVLTRTGLEKLEVSPRIDLNNYALLNEGFSGDAFPPERDRFNDLSMDGSLEIAGESGNSQFTINANFVGASYRPETLRFAEKASDAPKVDLADYLVTFSSGDAALEVGHVSYGNNPLLLDQFSTRGVKANYRINSLFDVSFSAQNGTEIVGSEQLLGLNKGDHRVAGATIGMEFFPEAPGLLRAEVTYMNASVLAINDFDAGEVPDAEKSDGFGLRVMGNAFTGRLRGDVTLARASYTNPSDPFLNFGFDDLVPVEETTNNAWRADIGYDIIQDYLLGGSTPVMLTADYTYEKINPEYRTIGAFPNADQLSQTVAFSAGLGSVSAQLLTAESEDNLDDIITILKTRTRTNTFNVELPLSEMLGSSETINYWPNISLNKERVRQFAINDPEQALSDFNGASHLPDQVSDANSAYLDWYYSTWNFTYEISRSSVDNRQTGRENADFKTINHNFILGVNPLDSMTIELSLGRNISDDLESDLRFNQEVGGIFFSWQFLRQWALAMNVENSRENDLQNGIENTKNSNFSGDVQVSYQFELPARAEKLPGQVFVRYARLRNDFRDNVFDFDIQSASWSVNAGMSISLF